MEPPMGGPWFLFLLLASLTGFMTEFSLGSELESQERPPTIVVDLGPKQCSLSRNESHAHYVIPCGKQCRCLHHLLSCAGGEGSERLPQVPTIKGYNDTFFYLDFSGNSISALHKRSWLTYSWAEILILKQNNLQKLSRDSFEGLLLLQHLDLSCNKIQTIDRHIFEPVPFLQSINLADNKLTILANGTFEAWHGMQFLAILFLSNNPLSNVSDTSFFRLTALKYLYIGGTKVAIQTIKTVMMTPPRLQKLVLPYKVACCLCQAQKKIESLCRTVKLQCQDVCDISSSLCKAAKTSPMTDDEFLKTLQSKRINSTVILQLEPEQPSLMNSGENLMELSSNDYHPVVQVNFNEEVNLLGGVNDSFPKSMPDYEKPVMFTARKLEKNGLSRSSDSSVKDQAGGPLVLSKTFNLRWADKNDLKKLSFLWSLLSSDVQKTPSSATEQNSRSLLHETSSTPQTTTEYLDKVQHSLPAGIQGGERMRIVINTRSKKIISPLEGNIIEKGNWNAWQGTVAECVGKQCQIQNLQSQTEKGKNKAILKRRRRNVPIALVTLILNNNDESPFHNVDNNNTEDNGDVFSYLTLVSSSTVLLFTIPASTPGMSSSHPSVVPRLSANSTTPSTIAPRAVLSQGRTLPLQFSPQTSCKPNPATPAEELVQRPGVQVQIPGEQIQRPGEQVQRPREQVQRPGEEIQRPGEEIQRPGEEIQRPGEQVQRPGEHILRPGEEIQRPQEEVQKPGEQVQKPGEQIQRPLEQFQKPGEQVQKPGEQVQKPGEQVQRPGEQIQRPGEQVQKPREQVQRPGEQVQRSGEQVQRPGEHVQRPGEQVLRPGEASVTLIQSIILVTNISANLNESSADMQNQSFSETEWNKMILNKLLQGNNEHFLANTKVIENTRPFGVADDSIPSGLNMANRTGRKLRPDMNVTETSEERDGSLFEMQLNAQLESLIPNKEVRALICHVIRILKMECLKPNLRAACENLVSKTGLLMKLFSERETGAWDSSWRMYINESSADTRKDKFPGYGNKLVLAICVTVIITIIIAGICVAEIHSDRSSATSAAKQAKVPPEGPLTTQNATKESHQASAFPREVFKPLWLQDLHKPLDSVRRKNMAHSKNHKESSDEEEIFNKATLRQKQTPPKKSHSDQQAKTI
ncbi:uncharacterized protein LOC144753804 isoform X2 [Lissotriton helveticus]